MTKVKPTNKEMSEILNLKGLVKEDANCSLAFLKNLNCVRLFRRKHWNLTKKYIIENTKHPVATGGTPITTWLTNQLGETLENMEELIVSLDMKIDKLSERASKTDLVSLFDFVPGTSP